MPLIHVCVCVCKTSNALLSYAFVLMRSFRPTLATNVFKYVLPQKHTDNLSTISDLLASLAKLMKFKKIEGAVATFGTEAFEHKTPLGL